MLQCGLFRSNLAFPMAFILSVSSRLGFRPEFHFVCYPVLPDGPGAGEGNRTLVISLEGCCSTIELHPPIRLPSPSLVLADLPGIAARTPEPAPRRPPDAFAGAASPWHFFAAQQRKSGGGSRTRTYEGEASGFT